MRGFLLGLANGTSCLALCAPVLMPYLVAEGGALRRNVASLLRFLLGRLLGYLVFGLAAGLLGALLAGAHPLRTLVFGATYLVLGGLLIAYGLSPSGFRASGCAAGDRTGLLRRLTARQPQILPVMLGLLTGLNLCPPFALAMADAVEAGSAADSVLFFLTFFLGTTVFFLPLPGLSGLRRFETLRHVARMAAAIVGAYYVYRGLILFYGGLIRS
jgi:sulfite exporter TauE/SafE